MSARRRARAFVAGKPSASAAVWVNAAIATVRQPDCSPRSVGGETFERGSLMHLHRPGITPSMAISVVALFVALGGSAYAATGDAFLLGDPNTADHASTLTSTAAAGAALNLVDTTTANTSSALRLTVDPSRPPLITNSSVQVPNLNASELDGLGASSLIHGHGSTGTAF